MARDMALLLLLVASALAAQDATSGPVHSSLRGAAGNSSKVESPRSLQAEQSGGAKCCKHGEDTTHCHRVWDDAVEDLLCKATENYPEAQCAYHGGLSLHFNDHCCTADDVGTAWVFGGCH